MTEDFLLSGQLMREAVGNITTKVRAARVGGQNVVRVTEANSNSKGGIAGISDGQAGALWTTGRKIALMCNALTWRGCVTS